MPPSKRTSDSKWLRELSLLPEAANVSLRHTKKRSNLAKFHQTFHSYSHSS